MKHMVHNFLKYIRITVKFFSLSVQKIAEYKTSFWLKTFSISMWLFSGFVWIYILYLFTDSIGGLTIWEYISFFGIHHFSISIFKFIFGPNLYLLSDKIYEGKIDMDIAKPISSQFLVSIKDFDLASLPNGLLGLLTFFVGITKVQVSVSFLQIFIFTTILFLSFLSFYSIFLIIYSTAFWTGRLIALRDVLETLFTDTSSVPTNLYGGFLKFFFYLVFPAALMATFPLSTILSGITIHLTIYYLVFTAILLILSRIVWKNGLRSYSSASS